MIEGMRTRRKWWARVMRIVPPCGRGQFCRLRRPLPLPQRGGWRPSPPVVSWGRLDAGHAIRRPGKPTWSAKVCGGAVGLRCQLAWFLWAGLLQFARVRASASATGNSLRMLHSGARGGRA